MFRLVLVGGVMLIINVYGFTHLLRVHDTTIPLRERRITDKTTELVHSYNRIPAANTVAIPFQKRRITDKAAELVHSHNHITTATTATIRFDKHQITDKVTKLVHSHNHISTASTATAATTATTTETNIISTTSTTTATTDNKRARETCTDAFKEVFEREKRFLCTHIDGGLGNFMFSFASVYGIASSTNRIVVIQKDNPLIKYFLVKAQIIDDLCICKTATIRYENKHCAFNKELLNLTEHGNYRPRTYLQSWKYFEHVADDVRQQFTFSTDVREKAKGIIKENQHTFLRKGAGNVTSYPVVTVGVHVRRGDITRNPQFVKYGYLVAPTEYFQKAMTYFRKKYQTPLFLVCSDDMKWCKENIVGSDVMYIEGSSFDVDLAILSHCNHSVISVGTFGWWSAFLAAGETIYYKHPVRNESALRKQFSEDFSDFFYPGWIGME